MSGDARASKALPRMVVVFGDETLSKIFISRQKLFYCSVRVHAVGGGFRSDYAYCGGLSDIDKATVVVEHINEFTRRRTLRRGIQHRRLRGTPRRRRLLTRRSVRNDVARAERRGRCRRRGRRRRCRRRGRCRRDGRGTVIQRFRRFFHVPRDHREASCERREAEKPRSRDAETPRSREAETPRRRARPRRRRERTRINAIFHRSKPSSRERCRHDKK
jgi:hypothetical protein